MKKFITFTYMSLFFVIHAQANQVTTNCLSVYQIERDRLISCYAANPLKLGSNPPTGISFWTTSAPLAIGPCLYYLNDYGKTIRLLSEGSKGDGIFLRQFLQKYNLNKEQFQNRVNDFINTPSNCDKDNLWSYAEVVNYLKY